ncbi:hypothetical protein GCM10007874_22510 [Labrys miyagiensis]|uniref:Uncharacterized protein n=1 Tax=Labrys miyagiensis TaxID=346912 RepID=A0ABQ6CHI6_9HYPH|nr:hypothetical protein GCM10007874_22510 [Labrys miyagiensis]
MLSFLAFGVKLTGPGKVILPMIDGSDRQLLSPAGIVNLSLLVRKSAISLQVERTVRGTLDRIEAGFRKKIAPTDLSGN